MTRSVTSYVTVVNPETGESVVFGPDDSVPAWAVKLIDNESVWAEAEPEPAKQTRSRVKQD